MGVPEINVNIKDRDGQTPLLYASSALLSFVFSFQKRTACKFFGQYDYCAEEPYLTIERLILLLFSFTLVCFSSIKMHIKMHQDVAQDYNTALFHMMYVFLAKGIILSHVHTAR